MRFIKQIECDLKKLNPNPIPIMKMIIQICPNDMLGLD